MSRSEKLYSLQLLDTAIDNARKRLKEIDQILGDDKTLQEAEQAYKDTKIVAEEKYKVLRERERKVSDQNTKIDQNQKKLYSGSITNPKELEDLQLEANSLSKYLRVLEDNQLEAMVKAEEAQTNSDQTASALNTLKTQRAADHQVLIQEKAELENKIRETEREKAAYLSSETLPDLEVYNSLRQSAGGIAVSLMISSSCLSCGANIPSAIEQQARSPSKLVFCPTCKRILNPG